MAIGYTDISSAKMLWRFHGEQYETPMLTWLIGKMPMAPIETIRALGKRIA